MHAFLLARLLPGIHDHDFVIPFNYFTFCNTAHIRRNYGNYGGFMKLPVGKPVAI